jgi:hypothetical protein
MNPPGIYDGTLQMFIQSPREVDIRRLRFLRWLAEHGQLEHKVAGRSAGPYCVATPEDPRRAA